MTLSFATKLSYVDTTVKNISGAEKFLTFLPKHGKRLADGESTTVRGVLDDLLSGNKRKQDGLHNALALELIRMTTNRHVVLYLPVDDTIAIAVGDMLYYDSGAAQVFPASEFTWDTDLATTQAEFHDVFAGIAEGEHLADSGDSLVAVNISPDVEYDFNTVSGAHVFAATMGPAKATGDALLNQKLDAALTANAIARILRVDTVAGTTALVNFQSAYWGTNAAAAQ